MTYCAQVTRNMRQQWLKWGGLGGSAPSSHLSPPAIVWAPPPDRIYSVILCLNNAKLVGFEWVWGLLQPGFVSWAPLLHKTTLTTVREMFVMRRVSGRWVHYAGVSERCERVDRSVFAEGKPAGYRHWLAAVKVRGQGAQLSLLPFEPPAIVWAVLDWIYKVLFYG